MNENEIGKQRSLEELQKELDDQKKEAQKDLFQRILKKYAMQ